MSPGQRRVVYPVAAGLGIIVHGHRTEDEIISRLAPVQLRQVSVQGTDVLPLLAHLIREYIPQVLLLELSVELAFGQQERTCYALVCRGRFHKQLTIPDEKPFRQGSTDPTQTVRASYPFRAAEDGQGLLGGWDSYGDRRGSLVREKRIVLLDGYLQIVRKGQLPVFCNQFHFLDAAFLNLLLISWAALCSESTV